MTSTNAGTSTDEGLPTDLSTAVMNTALPTTIDEDLPRPDGDSIPQFDRLVFYNRDLPTFTADLDKPIVTIGRAPNRTIVLQGTMASRNHVQIERKPNGRYYITDMKSTNGVWLGDERIPPDAPIILNPDVTVRLGDYWMQLLLKPEPSAEDLSASANGFDTNAPAPVEQAPPPDTRIVDDDMVTQAFDIQPKDKPRYTPPYLTADQMNFDRVVFTAKTRHIDG